MSAVGEEGFTALGSGEGTRESKPRQGCGGGQAYSVSRGVK